ncbi:MAG TPA: hypothetical protein VL356_06990 [Acidocella sp.]|nr:hypothetical protein [Acidocella sp.]
MALKKPPKAPDPALDEPCTEPDPVLENPPTVVDPVLEKVAVPLAVPLVLATPLPVAVPLLLFWADATPAKRTKRLNATAGVIPYDIVVLPLSCHAGQVERLIGSGRCRG